MNTDFQSQDTDQPLKVDPNIFNDNEEAMNVIRLLKDTNYPVFLTGKAGTGKSTLVNLIKQTSMMPLVCAPTGVAARNIGGITIHFAFSLPQRLALPNDKHIESLYFGKDYVFELDFVDVIIIDEISMVSSATIDCIDKILRQNLRTDEPFAGKKILLCGDPFQLPPIIPANEKEIIKSVYESEHFFHSKYYKANAPITIELQKNYRQEDQGFIQVLNYIRSGLEKKKSVWTLNNKSYQKSEREFLQENPFAITLTFTNKSANAINAAKLDEIGSEKFVFQAEENGRFDWKNVIAEKELQLKVGAKIMFIKNNQDGNYVNGTLGEILELSKNKVVVRTEDNKVIDVGKAKWTTGEYRVLYRNSKKEWKYEEVGTMYQYPIKLAWAITVHKSQGLTFDSVLLRNDSQTFAFGQLYVALSRCRSLKKLKLFRPLRVHDINVDYRIISFFNKILHDKERVNLILKEIESRNQNPEAF